MCVCVCVSVFYLFLYLCEDPCRGVSGFGEDVIGVSVEVMS